MDLDVDMVMRRIDKSAEESNVSDRFEAAISEDKSVQGFNPVRAHRPDSFRVIVYNGNTRSAAVKRCGQ
jgi:hypothetical protein